MRHAPRTQWLIDNLDYPPTHQYDLDSLTPKGVLEERISLLEKFHPDFFQTESILDIGANKGFFSAYARSQGCTTYALEPDPQFHELLDEVLNAKNIFKTGFSEFIPDRTFKIAWIGNAHHYLEYEASNYAWLRKLSTFIEDFVIIEGPNENCRDVPKSKRKQFSVDQMKQNIGDLFEVVDVAPTVSYTPGRNFIKLQKIQKRTPPLLNENNIDFIRSGGQDHLGNNKLEVISDGKYLIKSISGKINTNFTFRQTLEISIADISTSNHSPIIAWVERNGNKTGWVEAFSTIAHEETLREKGEMNSRILSPNSKKRLLQAQIERMLELASLGFTDIDFGIANWVEIGENKWQCFDKNSVVALESLNMDQLWAIEKVFKNNYPEIQFDRIAKSIVSTLSSRNPKIIAERMKPNLTELSKERSRIGEWRLYLYLRLRELVRILIKPTIN
jgi:hypothetical protein